MHLIIRKWTLQKVNTFVFLLPWLEMLQFFMNSDTFFFFSKHCIIGSFGMDIKIITVALPVPEVVMSPRFSPGNTSQVNREIPCFASQGRLTARKMSNKTQNKLKEGIEAIMTNESNICALYRWDTVIQNSTSPARPTLQSSNFEPTVRKIFILMCFTWIIFCNTSFN